MALGSANPTPRPGQRTRGVAGRQLGAVRAGDNSRQPVAQAAHHLYAGRALLTYAVLLTLAVLAMVVFMVRAGQPVVIPQVVIFVVMFAVSSGLVIGYLKHL